MAFEWLLATSSTKLMSNVVVPPSLRAPDRDIPLALDRVVMRALKKEPSERYASAR